MTEPSMTFVSCEQIANFVCVNTVNKKLGVFSKNIDKLEQLILSLSKSVSEVLNQNELGKSDVRVHVYNSQDDVQASDDTFELDCSSLDSSVSVEGSLDVGFVAADSFSSTSVEGHCSREQDVGLVCGSDQDVEIVFIGRSRVVESGRAAGIVGSGLYGVDSGRAAGILGGGQSGVVDSGRAAGIVGGFQSGVVDSGRAAGIVGGGQSSVVNSGRAAGIVGGGLYGVDSGRAAGIVGGFQSGVGYVDSGRAAGIVGSGQSSVDSGRAAGIVGGFQSGVVDRSRATGIVGGGRSVDDGRSVGIVSGQFGVVDSGRAAGIVGGGNSGFVDGGGDMEIVGGVWFTSGGSQGSCVSEGIGVPNYSNFDRTPLSINRSFGNRPLVIIRCAEDMSAVPPHAEILLHKDAIDGLLLEHQGSISKLSWSLAKQFFPEEDLVSGTFNGKGGHKMLSSRRKQLILKAVGYAFPGISGISGYDAAAINSGIRNRRNYKKIAIRIAHKFDTCVGCLDKDPFK